MPNRLVSLAVRAALLLALCVTLPPRPSRAQETLPDRLEVFLARELASTGARIFFMDPLSGLSTVVTVEDGRDFTLVGDYVMYEKSRAGAIMRATADGAIEPHPFIKHNQDLISVDWVASPDHQSIAWVLTDRAGAAEVYVAQADGGELQQLPIVSPSLPYVLRPLALSNGRTKLIYDMASPLQPPDLPFVTYAHLGEYNVRERAAYPLPAEPLCPCGAALTSDGRMLGRLDAANGQGPFALRLWDLPTQSEFRVAAPALPYRMAGDLLLNETGTRAIYAVAAGVGPEAGQFQEQYGLIYVDAVAKTQRLIAGPTPLRYRPIAFIDDNASVLAVGVNQAGTYKLDLATGALLRISADEYLGAIIVD